MRKKKPYLNDAPLAQIDAGTPEVLTYLHPDHLGTPKFATNTGGSQVWAANADAFGVGTPSGSATVNLRMPGQYYDSESGLFYNWNRYYSHALGRYVSSDPIGLEGGLNTFLYAESSPVMFVDPEGLRKLFNSGASPISLLPQGRVAGLVMDILTPTPLADATCLRNGVNVCATSAPTASAPAPTPTQICTAANPTGTLYNKPANDNNPDQQTGDVIPFPASKRPQTPRDCWEELFQCEARERISLVPNYGRCSDEFLQCMKQ